MVKPFMRVSKDALVSLSALLLCASPCRASSGDVRSIDEVFLQSDTILYGVVVASGLGKCGGKAEQDAYYTLRVRKVIKGNIARRDVKICGCAPILLGNWYVVAGNKYSKSELVYDPDAVLLNSFSGYYRLIAFDSPIFESSRGEVYGVGILAPDIREKFGDFPGADGP